MGPPIYIGGNFDGFLDNGFFNNRLQWGHRFISVETAEADGSPMPDGRLQWGHRFISVETTKWSVRQYSIGIALQWGHRFISVETTELPRLLDALELASMGPPIYIGGNSQAYRIRDGGDPASMGPPIYIGGNFSIEYVLGVDRTSFNGATDLYRWKQYLCF